MLSIAVESASLSMLRPLTRSDARTAQAVLDACHDYALLFQGHAFSPNAAEAEFDAVPSGFPVDRKRVFGIEGSAGHLVGLLEGLSGYPSNEVWYLGLLLVVPAARGRGVGTYAYAALESAVRGESFAAIELAVLKDNVGALAFWQRMGFTVIREVPAATLGAKRHERFAMRKKLSDA